MPDPTRKRIIAAIAAAFDSVRIYGLQPQVYLAQQSLSPPDLPAIIITPGIEEAERRYGEDLLTMPVTVSATAPLYGHPVVYATEELLALIRETVPGAMSAGITTLEDIRYTRGGVEEWPEPGGQTATVFAEFAVIYTTSANSSY